MMNRRTASRKTNIEAFEQPDTNDPAGQMVYRMYEQFLAVAPNSREPFVPTLANLQRWKWHIDEHIKRIGATLVRIEYRVDEEAEAYARARSFETFEQMPEYMQRNFRQIADLFPGFKCYAVGSRVTGRYAESWSGEEVRAMRRRLKRPEKVSDYDVYVEGITPAQITQAKRRLPKFADIQNYIPPMDNKVELPAWDFSKLPESEHAAVIDLFEGNKIGQLMLLHNKYRLSNFEYCCDEQAVRRWFKYGIDSGQIQKTKKGGINE